MYELVRKYTHLHNYTAADCVRGPEGPQDNQVNFLICSYTCTYTFDF